MKIRCRNCGTEFDSKFCPECGAPRAVPSDQSLAATPVGVRLGAQNTPVANPTKKGVIIGLIINIIRWIAIVFLAILSTVMLASSSILSSILLFISILIISPLNRKIPIKGIPRFIYGMLAFLIFILAFVVYHPSNVSTTEEGGKTKGSTTAGSDNTTKVLAIDKKTQKKINSIEKYIAEGKYEKAYKMLGELNVDDGEKTRLYALYYIGVSDYNMAESVLYKYCSDYNPLSNVEGDPLYDQLLSLYDKVPGKQQEIDLFKHAVYVSKVGYEDGHDWISAGCTTKKTCKICGEETGEPLGHDWVEATCTDARKCRRCGKREGDPLGHEVEEWSVTVEPTCSEEGIEIGICARCGEEVERKVAKTAHTPGTWEITRETTSASVSGEKSLLCKVCGEVMETEPYNITKEEELKIYRSSFESVTYEQLSRYPDSYKGKRVKVKVKIVDEIEEGLILYTPYKAKMGGRDIAISDGRDVKEPKLLKGDTVTIYGVGDGTETVKTKRPGLLWDKTVDSTEIPMVKMLYCEF